MIQRICRCMHLAGPAAEGRHGVRVSNLSHHPHRRVSVDPSLNAFVINLMTSSVLEVIAPRLEAQ